MKKTLHIISFAAVALALLSSCAKEEFKENAIPAGEPIEVSINGQIGEFTPADATKATAESVVRVTWGSGDKVYVYDGGNASIGTLTVTPDNNNASYAMLSGTITASSASPSKLTLVYVKGATEAPTIAGGKISVDLSSQNQTEVPFVLYTTVAYDAAALTKTNEYTSFTFATSVMTVNCTGLQTGASGAVAGIDKAEIDGVSTACELTIDGSGVTAVAGTTPGTITRTAGFTQADSRGAFRLALAADPAAPAARNILVFQGSKVSGAPFTSTTLAGGKSYNTVYQMGEYVPNTVIIYRAAEKLSDYDPSDYSTPGLHTDAFGDKSITSHTFNNGVGIITFNGKVELIGDYAFENCGITYVGIPASVKEIGRSAFACQTLEQVFIADGSELETIGNFAFYNSAITSFAIPAFVTKIDFAFYHCYKLTTVSFASDCRLAVIGEEAFNGCGIKSITIPSSVTKIGVGAFWTSRLTSVNIPATVTEISQYAFKQCYQLAVVTFAEGSSLSTIGSQVFASTTGLKSIDIPESVTTIGDSAFYESGLPAIKIPKLITKIGDYAFKLCADLTKVTFANDIQLSTIGEEAFYDSGLASVNIPATVTGIGQSAFNCSSLREVIVNWDAADKIPSITWNVFYYVKTSRTLYVPSGMVDTYKNTDKGWNLDYFGAIIEQ